MGIILVGRNDIKRTDFRETGDREARKNTRKETIRIYIVLAFSFFKSKTMK